MTIVLRETFEVRSVSPAKDPHKKLFLGWSIAAKTDGTSVRFDSSPQRPFFLNAIEAIRPLMAAKGMDLTLVVEYHYVQEMRLLQWSPDDLVNWLKESNIHLARCGCQKNIFSYFSRILSPFLGKMKSCFFFIFGSWVFLHRGLFFHGSRSAQITWGDVKSPLYFPPSGDFYIILSPAALCCENMSYYGTAALCCGNNIAPKSVISRASP